MFDIFLLNTPFHIDFCALKLYVHKAERRRSDDSSYRKWRMSLSFADRTIIDLRVGKGAPEAPGLKPSHVNPDIRLPAVVAFYGANASGKTNVLTVLTKILEFVVASVDAKPGAEMLWLTAFRNDKGKASLSKVAIEFEANWVNQSPHLFRYEVHFNNSGAGLHQMKSVKYEALHYKKTRKFVRLFERDENQVKVGDDFGITKNDKALQRISSNSSVISTLSRLNHDLSEKIWGDLNNIQALMLGIDALNQNNLLNFLKLNPDIFSNLKRLLPRLDVGIENLEIIDGSNGPLAFFYHMGLEGPLGFPEESSGTRHFVSLFPVLSFVLQTGQIAIIDEIDRDIHPMALPEIINWFHNDEQNPNKAQLFLTAHNQVLLDYLSQEQIYFVEKRDGSSEVYGARDIKGLRRDVSLQTTI